MNLYEKIKMKPLIIFILFFATFSHLYSQQQFRFKIDAPDYKGDSLIFSAPIIKVGLEDLYNLNIRTNKYVSAFKMMAGKSKSVFQVTIQPETIIEGVFEFPQPVALQYYDRATSQVYVTSRFFIDSGTHVIRIPKKFHSYPIHISSSINSESENFRKIFEDLYSLDQDSAQFATLQNIDEKQIRMGDYIKNNPGSFVALWEIVNDYTLYGYNFNYLKNLELFSDDIKKNDVYLKLKEKLISENSTMKGTAFPELSLDATTFLNKDYFKKYKFTFIDFWSITCSPCIKEMPTILSMYKNYVGKGVNFISITAENESEHGERARSILTRVNSMWTNYFDDKSEFSKKLGVTAYPLYLLIDDQGVIIEKNYGDLKEIAKRLSQSIK